MAVKSKTKTPKTGADVRADPRAGERGEVLYPAPPARGEQARAALLRAATRVFAEKGFAKASTREICEMAGVNVAAIHYYFSDKAGLYRAVYILPVEQITASSREFDSPELSFAESMNLVYGAFLTPMREGDELMAAMRLHLREMVDPSGEIGDLLPKAVAPHFEAMQRLIMRHLGVRRTDEDVKALASTLMGMVHDYVSSADVHCNLAPTLSNDAAAINRMQVRLVRYACGLLAQEAARRLELKKERH